MVEKRNFTNVRIAPIVRTNQNAANARETESWEWEQVLNEELTEIHEEVPGNPNSIHGALLRTNRSIQAEGHLEKSSGIIPTQEHGEEG